MEEPSFTLDELKTEKQKETFAYSLKMNKLNKLYKLKLAENEIIPDKNLISNPLFRKYIKEIFEKPLNIVEFYENEIEKEKVEELKTVVKEEGKKNKKNKYKKK
jgi:hypothetical protein